MILLWSFVLTVGLGVALAYLLSMRGELDRQSQAIADIRQKLAAGAKVAPGATPGATPAVPPPPKPAAPPPAAATTTATRPSPPSPPPADLGATSISTAAKASPAAGYGGWERTLGTQWAVWLGGIALALGGIFLVRYTIEAGLLGPGVRILLGGLLALVLAGLGEWARRREINLGVAIPAAHIPSVLTAAATVVAFGTVYAAHALYDFIGPAAAFLLLGATGLLAMLAAVLHGPALAGLGLAGSFLTPALISSQTTDLWLLVLFLAVVAAAAYLIARARRWLWLAAVAVAGAFAWGVLMLVMLRPDGYLPVAAHALVQLTLAAIFMAIEPHLGSDDGKSRPDWIATAALAVLAILVCGVLAAVPHTFGAWLPLAIIAMAVLLATAWQSPSAAAAAPIAGLIALSVALLWPGVEVGLAASRLWEGVQPVFLLPETISTYLGFNAVAALGIAAAATLRLWHGRTLAIEVAALYLAAATLVPLLVLIVTYLRVTQFDASMSYSGAAMALAAIFTLAADRFERTESTAPTPAVRLATATLAAAAIAALSLALVAVLERGYLTVALALTALGTAYAAEARGIRLLRYAVAALGGVVLLRMVWDPRIMGDSMGTWPILNWLLVGYGVPAAAFAGAAHLMRPRGEDIAVRLADGLSVLFVALFAVFQVRHLMTGGDPFAATAGHVELGLQAVVAIGLSLVLSLIDLRRANVVFYVASLVIGGLAVGIAVIGLALLANPLFSGDLVGGRPVLSTLVPGYLLPGLMGLVAARLTRGRREAWYTVGAACLGLFLIVLYATLGVRHAFQGADISALRETSQPEHWAHSATWLLLGVVLLGYGLWRGSIEARIVSGLLVAIAAIKIVVFDLAGITGLWRALSFLCLGSVLIGIGAIYQRLVFSGAPGATGTPAAPPPST